MFKAAVGNSTNKDPVLAGMESTAKIKEVNDNPKLMFVYTSEDYDQNELLKSIKKEVPNTPIIGNTSSVGVITPEGFISDENGFVAVMGLFSEDLDVAVASEERGDNPRNAGRKAALKALEKHGANSKPDYFYMAAPPGEEEYYLKGITEVVGRIPMFGGSSADNNLQGNWLQFTDESVVQNGVVVALFFTEKEFANVYTGAYRETENSGIITKLDGDRTLVEINGIPAIEQYKQWTGANDEETKGGNLLVYSVLKPLGVKDRLGDLIAIRHPMNGNEDGSISLGNNMAVNTAIVQMETDVDGLINAVSENIEKLKSRMNGNIAAYHLVHCGGRRIVIDNRINEVYEKIVECTDGKPFVVEFTFGEYGFEDDGNNTCGGLMLSFTAFGE